MGMKIRVRVSEFVYMIDVDDEDATRVRMCFDARGNVLDDEGRWTIADLYDAHLSDAEPPEPTFTLIYA